MKADKTNPTIVILLLCACENVL